MWYRDKKIFVGFGEKSDCINLFKYLRPLDYRKCIYIIAFFYIFNAQEKICSQTRLSDLTLQLIL